MAAAAPALAPIDAPLCPLCGQPNACAAVAAGRFDVPCWCQSVSIPAHVLARVPEAERGRACICAACVGAGSSRSGEPAPQTETSPTPNQEPFP